MNVNVHNCNTLKIIILHTFRLNMDLHTKILKYNIPHTINYTPYIVTEKVLTQSMHVSHLCKKSISFINTTITALLEAYIMYAIIIRSICNVWQNVSFKESSNI